MKKFEDRPETGYFVVDPIHLAAGLAAAKKKKRTAIRVSAIDARTTNLSFDASPLAGQTWIRKLVIDDDLTPTRASLASLHDLAELEELGINEYAPLDFARFPCLRTLVLNAGSSLAGLEKVTTLNQLYLIAWKGEELPREISELHASNVRISACRRLRSVARLARLASLRELVLQDLPRLEAEGAALEWNGLERLNVERVGFSDFSELASPTLVELELFTKHDSLRFLPQLPALRRLYLWECVDGDMSPVLAHPSLEEIYFDKNRKHYTHNERQLQASLQARKAS